MDQRLQDIAEHFDELKIGLDDTFQFRCKRCGKCCHNRNDILLNPLDLFKIANYFGKTPAEIVHRYCNLFIGSSSKMPIIKVQFIGTDNHCPFLFDKRCSIHSCKPTVCALYPLGRTNGPPHDKHPNGTTAYILQKINCGDQRETHIVRDWLEDSGVPIEDPFFHKWTSFHNALCPMLIKFEKHTSPSYFEQLINYIGSILYLCYDIRKDFMEQFESNTKELLVYVQNFYDMTFNKQ